MDFVDMAYDLSTPLAALREAVDMIEAYQFDIRNSGNYAWVGVDLEDVGFCQGRYYRELYPKLQQALQRFEREVDNERGT